VSRWSDFESRNRKISLQSRWKNGWRDNMKFRLAIIFVVLSIILGDPVYCRDMTVAFSSSPLSSDVSYYFTSSPLSADESWYFTSSILAADVTWRISSSSLSADLTIYVTSSPLSADKSIYISSSPLSADKTIYVVNPEDFPKELRKTLKIR
jgi:hypothetical protein